MFLPDRREVAGRLKIQKKGIVTMTQLLDRTCRHLQPVLGQFEAWGAWVWSFLLAPGLKSAFSWLLRGSLLVLAS